MIVGGVVALVSISNSTSRSIRDDSWSDSEHVGSSDCMRSSSIDGTSS